MPAGRQRPHVVLGMVSSADGAAAVEGRTRALGGEADRIAFRRLREVCDVILVGAETARVEGYGPPKAHPGTVERRRARGLADLPRLAVVTGSGRIPAEAPMFRDPQRRPVVLTTQRAEVSHLADRADVVRCGDGEVDLAQAVMQLRQRGARRVLCEGGPRLNAGLLEAGLVDELFLTLTATIAGGDGPRIVAGAESRLRSLALVSVHEHGGELMLRYRLEGATGAQ